MISEKDGGYIIKCRNNISLDQIILWDIENGNPIKKIIDFKTVFIKDEDKALQFWAKFGEGTI